jgi:hypothetical protein
MFLQTVGTLPTSTHGITTQKNNINPLKPSGNYRLWILYCSSCKQRLFTQTALTS